MGVIMDKLAEPLGNTPQGRLDRLTGELGRQATLLDAEAKRLGSNGGAGDGMRPGYSRPSQSLSVPCLPQRAWCPAPDLKSPCRTPDQRGVRGLLSRQD